MTRVYRVGAFRGQHACCHDKEDYHQLISVGGRDRPLRRLTLAVLLRQLIWSE